MGAVLAEEKEHGNDPVSPGAPGFDSELPRAVHRCLEEVWKRTGLRARLFLLEGNDLVLRACIGGYPICPRRGLKVNRESVVWEIFRKGEPENLTDSSHTEGRPHTLASPVFLKAVIPLRATLEKGRTRDLGVLVVDAGGSGEVVQERDFHYLQLVASLMAEILWNSVLMTWIRLKEAERERMAREVSHIFRNRLTVIGGFARRLARGLLPGDARKWAEIIREEVAAAERALEQWRNAHPQEEMIQDNGPGPGEVVRGEGCFRGKGGVAS
jgi:hypothetical protein